MIYRRFPFFPFPPFDPGPSSSYTEEGGAAWPEALMCAKSLVRLGYELEQTAHFCIKKAERKVSTNKTRRKQKQPG